MNYINMVARVDNSFHVAELYTSMFLRIEVDTAITRESVGSSLIREQLLEDIDVEAPR